MISCLLRRGDAGLNSGSWIEVNSAAYVNDKHDFYNTNSNIAAGDHVLAHTYGYLEGSAYNYGNLRYRILIDADELGSIFTTANMNEFNRDKFVNNLVVTNNDVTVKIDVVLTIWYMQGE